MSELWVCWHGINTSITRSFLWGVALMHTFRLASFATDKRGTATTADTFRSRSRPKRIPFGTAVILQENRPLNDVTFGWFADATIPGADFVLPL